MPSITDSYRRRVAQVRTTADGADLLPVTGAQRRLHHLAALDPHGRPAVVPLAIEYPAGTVSVARLQRAAAHVIRHHPALRAWVGVLGGIPVQRIGDIDVDVTDALDGGPAPSLVRAALDDWPAGRRFRVFLARDGDGERELLTLAFDHVVCDEFSIGEVLARLSAAYHGDVEAPPEAEAVTRYRDAVDRQLDREAAASGPDALAHWARRLRQARPGRWGRGHPGDVSGPSRSVGRTLGLPALGGVGRSRLFPTLLAACHVAVAPDPDIAPPSFTWGGRGEEAEPVVGCFLNTVMACRPGEDDDPFTDVLHGWWDDLEWIDTPFDEVVRLARREGAAWTGHLDVLVTLDDRTRRPALVLDGVAGRETPLPGMRVQAPVVVSASYDVDRLHLRVDHDSSLVAGATADRLLDGIARSVSRQ